MSVYETHGKTTTSPESVALQDSNRLLPRWFRSAIRAWQRRRMIALLSALDDRTLLDIGIHRGQIPRVVEQFDDHKLRMVPVAPEAKPAVAEDYPLRKAA